MSDVITYQMNDLQTMAKAMGPLFSKKPEDLFALMLIAQAEHKHPAIAAQEYDIIQGRPALKSQATLARFQAAGGKIDWKERTDKKVSATFTHSQGGSLTVTWTIERASQAGLTGKDNWKKFPTQMLSARVIAEGVRAVFPACLSGFYLTEEVQDIEEPAVQPAQAYPKASAKQAPKDDAIPAQAEEVKDDPQAKVFQETWTEVIKEVATILGAKDAPEAWTQEERDTIEAKTIPHKAKEAKDESLLKALLYRARIGHKVRGTEDWAKVMPQVVAMGTDLDSLEAVLVSLSQPKHPGTPQATEEAPELEGIY